MVQVAGGSVGGIGTVQKVGQNVVPPDSIRFQENLAVNIIAVLGDDAIDGFGERLGHTAGNGLAAQVTVQFGRSGETARTRIERLRLLERFFTTQFHPLVSRRPADRLGQAVTIAAAAGPPRHRGQTVVVHLA